MDRPIFLRPLIPVALAFMAGIGLGAFWPGCFGGAAAAVLVMAAAMAGCMWRRHSVLILPLLFFAGIGYLSIQPWLKSEWPSNHVRHYVDQGKWQVTGVMADQPQDSGQRKQFIVDAVRLKQARREIDVGGKIKVTVRGRIPSLNRGDTVVLSGHLRAIRSFCNPGGFDYQHFMALQGVQAKLYAQGGSLRRQGAVAPEWRGRLDMIRRRLSQRMTAVLQDHPPAGVQVLKALTLGEREGIGSDLRESFSRAGVSHVLAISGLHIGMVAAAAFALFSRLLAWIPPLTRRAWVRKAAAVLSLIPVVGYGLLAGLSPSTQRAMIMVAAFLITFWIGRRHDWLNALAVAALVILVVSPPSLVGVSFQLSFAAVLAIILGMNALPLMQQDSSHGFWHRWVLRAVSFVSVSVLAIMGTAPLVMRYFNQVSWVGPITNLMVVPLAGAVVVPAGLLGVVFAPLSHTISGACWQIAASGTDILVWLIEKIARFPFAASFTVTPSLIEMALFYLLLATLLIWPWRKIRIVGLMIVISAAGLDSAYWIHRRFTPRQMTVTAVDVGQGSANVLQLPGGFTVLVDGGGFSDNAAFDVGRSVVAPLLWRNKIKTVDLVILTHPNSDHLNGLLFVLDQFHVAEFWSNYETADTVGYHRLQQAIALRGIRHVPFDRLPRQAVHHGVRFEILGPPSDFLKHRETEPWRDLNNNSLVVRVSWADVSFLFTGDVMKAAEADLVARHGAEGLGSTVLFVPHHGSRSSSTPAFLQAVRPEASIISLGWKNRFRFPHPKVIQRLENIDTRIWRIDQCGAVQIVTDGKAYHIQTCRKGCESF